MKSRKRVVIRGVLNHCYQRTVGGEVIFYCISDYLVYFTTLCSVIKKYKVRLLALTLMPDHIHLSLIEDRTGEMSAFIGECTGKFSEAHNRTCHRKGSLFESPYGSAVKMGDKKVRTNLIYLGNNPTERRLCKNAEEYRWNFLAYASSKHPFSEPLIIREVSWHLRKAIKEVCSQYSSGRPLVYRQLQRLFSTLNLKEKEQLVDYIISKYNVIDYKEAIRYFDSFEDMIAAMHSNTGSEHDINEVFVGKSDVYYTKMANVLLKEKKLSDIHDVLGLSVDEKYELFTLLRHHTDAPAELIAAFLRMSLRKANSHANMP